LQGLSNLRIEFEQVKGTLFETHNRLQTCSLELKTLQKTLKNHDKELITIKGQLSKVQHENKKLSNKLIEA
jgi:septal ring factor EnvC (AmiA/AmiB activator)